VLRPRRIDPADYPDRMHVVWIGSNRCSYIASAPNDQIAMERFIETAEAVLEYHGSTVALVSHHNFLLNRATDEQLARLARLGLRR